MVVVVSVGISASLIFCGVRLEKVFDISFGQLIVPSQKAWIKVAGSAEEKPDFARAFVAVLCPPVSTVSTTVIMSLVPQIFQYSCALSIST